MLYEINIFKAFGVAGSIFVLRTSHVDTTQYENVNSQIIKAGDTNFTVYLQVYII